MKEIEQQFINECTKRITDGVIDIDERIHSGKVEVLVRKVLKKELKWVLKALSSIKANN